jgi:hypothetical protein
MNSIEQRREYILNAIASYPTQAKAAEAIGTSPKVISRWNTNRAAPKDLAARVVQLLEVLKQAGIEPPPPMTF